MHKDKEGPGIYPEFSYWTPIYRCITCIITETRRRDISDHSLISVFLKVISCIDTEDRDKVQGYV